MKAILFFLFFSYAYSIATFANGDHDIHLSLCELRYNEASGSFEVSIRIFIDDLEAAIEKEGIKGLGIGTPKEIASADEYIASYLDKHFSIVVDNVKLKGSFLGKEITDDHLAVWCYVEYPNVKAGANKCILSNNILFEVYDDQRNIMDIRMTKSHKDYTIFERSKDTWSYTY